MDEPEPTFITTLMSADTPHDRYFNVGDPLKGNVERIGVVSTMLMAHSLLFRRLLGDDQSDLDDRWDMTFTGFSPKIFKIALKYTYGYHKYNCTLPELVELLNLSEFIFLFQFKKEIANQIIKVLEPKNICLFLKNPICLKSDQTKEEFTRMINANTETVLNSPHFLGICAESVRFIVDMEGLEVSKIAVWKAVMKWARHKVLGEEHTAGAMQQLTGTRFIPPCLKHVRLCTLCVITKVENAESFMNSKSKDIPAFKGILPSYHSVPNVPEASVLLCTHNRDDHHITHEEFDVKEILDCSTWMNLIFRTASEITIHTKDSSLELRSLVCSACKKDVGELSDIRSRMIEAEEEGEYPTVYYCVCYVRIFLVCDGREEIVADVTFKGVVELDEEFEVILLWLGKTIVLAPKSKYKVTINFPSSPHPMCFANDVDYLSPKQSNGPDIYCGMISKTNNWYGSHAKYLLYREM